VTNAHDPLPEDKDALRSALEKTRDKLAGAEAMIEHLQLVIAKMRREKFGPRSERSQRILDQLELQLEELAAAQGEEAAKATPQSVEVNSFNRRRATRRNIPDHCRADALFILPRRRARAAAVAISPRSVRMSPRRAM